MDHPRRTLVCPSCGYHIMTNKEGVLYCGPHKGGDSQYTPAVQMCEVDAEVVDAVDEPDPIDRYKADADARGAR